MPANTAGQAMTISTTTNQQNFIGDGVTLGFSYQFPFISTSDLKIYVAGILQTTGYSVTGTQTTGGSGTFSSGTVQFLVAPAALVPILIYCDPDLLQSTSLPPNDPFPSKTVEKMVDKVTLLIQAIYRKFGNALTFPAGDTANGVLPSAALRASKLASFDASGNVQVVAPSSGSATALAIQLADPTSAANGDALVGHLPAGTGAQGTTVQEYLRRETWADDYKLAADPDYTNAINRAYAALGGNGIIKFRHAIEYTFTTLAFDGVLNLTFRGQAGGNLGNTSVGSFAGATVLRSTQTAAGAITFTGTGYTSRQLVFEDLVVHAATTGYTLSFDNCAQVHFNRVMVINDGNNAASNGVNFSRCFLVEANALQVIKGLNQRVGTCKGLNIDMGANSSFLGGEYNFTNCGITAFQTGLTVGSGAPSAANENYANVNWIGGELQANQVGVALQQGVKAATFYGCYIEANTDKGAFITLGAKNVTFKNCFLNNYSAGDSDIRFGTPGAGYQAFFNCAVEDCTFLAVKAFGVISSAVAGSSIKIRNNNFTLGTAGAVGINSNIAVPKLEDNTFNGFAAGNLIQGSFRKVDNNDKYASFPLAYSLNAADIQIATTDPQIITVVNTRAGAKLLAPSNALIVGINYTIISLATSTQNVLLRNSADTVTLATITPGKMAALVSDQLGAEFGSLLP